MKITQVKALSFPPDGDVLCVSVCSIFSTLHTALFLISAPSPWLRAQSKALREQRRHVFSAPDFLAPHPGKTSASSTPQPSILFSPLLSHARFQTDPQPMCTRCPPPTPGSTPRPSSLSLLTPLFDTDTWNCYQYWLLSQPLSPTLHAVYFVFLFLIPYQVKNK